MSITARTLLAFSLAACASCATGDTVPTDSEADSTTAAALLQPPSARVALDHVLGVLKQEEQSGSPVAIRSIDAKEKRGRIDIRLDLVIPAENDVVASQYYGELRGALAAEDWCTELNRPNTYPLSGTKGISVKGLEISVGLPSGAPVGVPLQDEPMDVSALIRSVATGNAEELGRIAISPSERRPDELSIDRLWKIAPHAKQSAASMASVLDFAASLEAAKTDAVVTEIRLTPVERPAASGHVAAWRYEVSMTVRERAS